MGGSLIRIPFWVAFYKGPVQVGGPRRDPNLENYLNPKSYTRCFNREAKNKKLLSSSARARKWQ